MGDLGTYRAARDARRSRTARLQGINRYDEAVNRYLGAFGYADATSLAEKVRESLRQGPAEQPATIPEIVGTPAKGCVVVGVDGSPGSFVAVDQATIEAELRGWDMRLVHVQHSGLGVRSSSRDRGAALLEEMIDRVHSWSPGVAVVSRLRVGSPAAVLIEDSAGAGLVVVGAGSRGQGAGVLTGSVSSHVAAHAHGPVLVIRVPDWPPGPGWATRPVVVGVDGSPGSEAAVEFAVQEARLRGSELVALYAVAEQAVPVGGRPDPLAGDGVAALAPAGVNLHRRRVEADPRSALVAASAHAAAIVVGSRGKGGVGGLLLGSVSQALIHQAHCPVFVVH